MAGVDYETGEIRPLLVDHATGYLLLNIFGSTDPGGSSPPDYALHDDNSRITMTGVEEGTENIKAAVVDHRTVNQYGGFVWFTLI